MSNPDLLRTLADIGRTLKEGTMTTAKIPLRCPRCGKVEHWSVNLVGEQWPEGWAAVRRVCLAGDGYYVWLDLFCDSCAGEQASYDIRHDPRD